MNRFENRVAVITGGASGIGLATAKRFAMEGAKIVLADLNAEKMAAAEAQIRAAGSSGVWSSECDISNPKLVEKTVQGTLERFGQVDVIVNNAGLMIFKNLEDHTAEDWTKILAVDLMGTFYFIQQGFLHMKPGSSIVNVSSIHAVQTTAKVSSYAAAKAAVLSLTRTASIEGKSRGIRVNAILPGAVDTPMLWQNPNIKAGIEVLNPNDIGKPEDIASAIAYLASQDSKFIQGASLRVDGGRLATL